MLAFTRILCPVDFSDCSRHALEQAATLARQYRASVTALHVFAVAPVAQPIAVGAPIVLEPARASAGLRQSVTAELRAFTDSVDTGGTLFELTLAEGDTADAIVCHAREREADLIVMGTHGRSGFERLMLGSVAESVLRKTPCPVLTVPNRVDSATSPAFARILCAVDFSPASLRALGYAAALAPSVGGDLCALHVVELVTGDGDGLRDDIVDPATDYREAFKRAAQERLDTIVRSRLGPDNLARTLVTIGRPHREIVRIAERERYDLIVLGVEARSAADLLLFGSTTQNLLRRAPCPVLTIRE
jgi:nucleotide-binding universal stress UspA family protein